MTALDPARGNRQPVATDAGPSLLLQALGSAPVVATLIVVAFQILFMVAGMSRFWTGELVDADAYMRLQRVVELAENGRWYDPFWTRTNAPYGETMHYTRPLDALLLAGAWVGSAITDFRTALWVWGGVLSPLLLVLSLLVLRWGVHPFLEGRAAFALCVLLACAQPALSSPFTVGRPDHHSLIALVLIAQLACLGRMTDDREPTRLALVAGALGGFGIWVSVELVLAQALVATALAMLWIWNPDPGPGLHAIRNYTIGLFAALSVALGLERPPGDWSVPAVARISIVHWWLAALALLSWLAISAAGRRWHLAASRPARCLLLALGGLIPALGTLAIYPQFFAGPWHDFGPLIRVWLDGNVEMQPLFPYNLDRARMFFFQLGPAIVALMFVAWRMPKAPTKERQILCILLIGLAIYLPLALAQMRWAMYIQILILLPWTLCLTHQWRWRGAVQLHGRRVPLRVAAFASGLVSHVIIVMVLSAFLPSMRAGLDQRACRWPKMAAFLERNHVGGPGDDILFTYLFPGSEMMWRTPYDVVATPHGNEPALLDMHRIFDARADSDARAVLDRRGIDLVLICPANVEARAWHDMPADRTVLGQLERGEVPSYHIAAGDPAPDRTTFHTRLKEGLLPPWIAPVELPAELAPFQLFRVAGPSRGRDGREAAGAAQAQYGRGAR